MVPLFVSVFSFPPPAFSQGTAFTYQGRLEDGGNPANGIYEFQFTIYDSSGGPAVVAGPLTNAATSVSNGLFTATLDFGPGVFTGAERWLEIGVRTNGGGAFTRLDPRQRLTAAPSAIYAANAAVAASANAVSAANVTGTLALAQLPAAVLTNNSGEATLGGTFSGDGAGLSNVNAAMLGGSNATNFWQLGGNPVAAGQFLGSVNAAALELRAAGSRVARFEPTVEDATHSAIFNVLAGSPSNAIAPGVYGATLLGGGAAGYLGWSDSLANQVTDDFGTVAGGAGNIGGRFSAVGGGLLNSAGNQYATVAGGRGNTASGQYATVAGGNSNVAAGLYSFAGGVRAKALHDSAFVWNDAASADLASTTDHQVTLSGVNGIRLLSGDPATVTVNGQPVLAGIISAAKVNGGRLQVDDINAGEANTLTGTNSAVLSGNLNTNAANLSALAGGGQNSIAAGADHAFIGGGQFNVITDTGHHAAIPGGSENTVAGQHSFAGGIRAKALHDYSFVWNTAAGGDFASTAQRQFRVNALGGVEFLTGLNGLTVDGQTVLAGTIDASKMSGGMLSVWRLNVGTGHSLGGGSWNGIAGGVGSTNQAEYSFVGGGHQNAIFAGADYSFIGGGQLNLISNNALYATIAGGSQNVVAGQNSFAGGIRAKAMHDFSFVWNDAAGTDLVTTTNHQFLVRALQGVQFLTGFRGMTVDGQPVHAGIIGASKISGGVLNVDQLKVGPGHTLGGAGASIAGGEYNTANGDSAFIGGGTGNVISTNTSHGAIGGGWNNTIQAAADTCTIAGGERNLIGSNNFESVIGGGHSNRISQYAIQSAILGGHNNQVGTGSYLGTIGGGHDNVIETNAGVAVIVGGNWNTVSSNSVNGVIGGGKYNRAGTEAVVPGGAYNEANGKGSFAAGRKARAQHEGAFVWADATDEDFASTATNQFLVRAQGGVGINTNDPAGHALAVVGDARVTGLVRAGSETGTSEPPSPAGLVHRRLNSISTTSNAIVAVARVSGSASNLALVRDGSSGGFQVQYPAASGRITIACMGMDSSGTSKNFYTTITSPAVPGVVQIYSNAQNVVHFACTFGDTYNAGQHLTQATLSRFGTDSYWSGNVISTLNQ